MNNDNLTADHDLLIRLDQKVENLTNAIQELTNNTVKRLELVEDAKAGRDELNVVIENYTTALNKEEIDRVKADSDIETRMRSVERFVYITMGIAIIAQLVILPIVLKYATN